MGAIGGGVRRAVPARLDPDQHAGRPLPPQADRRGVDGAVVGRRVRHRRWSRTPSGCSSPAWAPASASRTRCRSTPRCSMDAYPIPARSRVFAAYGSFEIAGRVARPAVRRRRRRRRRRARELALGLRRSPPLARRPGRRAGLGRSASPAGAATRCRRCSGEELADDRARAARSRSASPSSGCARSARFHFFLTGMAALGFALFSIPLFLNLYLEDELGLSAWERGVFGSLGDACRASSPWPSPAAGSTGCSARSPPAAVVFVGRADRRRSACSIVVGLYMPNVVLRRRLLRRGRGAVARPRSRRSCRRHGVGHPVPAAVAGHRHGRRLPVPVRRVLRRGAHRAAQPTPLGRRGALTLVVLPATLIGGGAHRLRRPVHPGRHLALRRGAARGAGRGRPGARPRARRRCRRSRSATSTSPTAPVQVLFDVTSTCSRGETLALLGTNGAGQVDAAAGDQRPRRRQPGRRAPARPHDHLHRPRAAGPHRHRPAHGRQRRVRLADGRREPAHGRLPLRRRRPRAAGSTPALARFPALADRGGRAAARPVGRPAADAGPGHGPRARARGADHRRAVAGPGADHGAGAARRPSGSSRTQGHDDDHRRAVAQRGPGRRRPGRVHGEGRRSASTARPASWPSATTWPGPCSSGGDGA